MARVDRLGVVQRIERSGVIAVIRADDATQAVDLCKALAEGGVCGCEVAMTTPKALRAIEEANDALADAADVGVGSVLDGETARAAIDAGASFVFSPVLDHRTVEMAHRYSRPVVPGALTPNEVHAAWSAGADLVKIFPASHFGPAYMKELHGPMPQVKLTPTGGVDLDNAGDWIRAGAAVLGVGTALVKREWARSGDWSALRERAEAFTRAVAEAREADA